MKNFLLVVAFALMTFPAFAAGKPVVKIGVTLPLTGDLAFMGEGVRNAVTLAKANLPADTKFDYEVVFEDDMLEAKKTAAAVNKMISADKVDALISLGSGSGGVTSPVAEHNKVLHFGIASAASVADGEFNFNHWTSPEEEARLMAEELKKRGHKKVAGLFLNQQGVLAIRDALKSRLQGSDVQLVADEIINPGEKDFRTTITKARAAEPDIYLIIFFTPELEILTKQIREAAITQPITSIEGFSLSNEQALYEGMWYVDSAEAKNSFYEQYDRQYHKAPSFGAPNAYDAFMLIVKGYEAANAPPGIKPPRENVVQALYGVKDYDGVLGKLSIDSKGVVFSPAAVKVIKSGKPVSADAAAAAQNAGAPEAVEPAGAQ
ncbi:MAG: ABC transporter substrate-binding protein [Alphaproteobacteria bacterium]|nr:ABC transporter substrate-binding protein [Alphaproteobacteria bacterium]